MLLKLTKQFQARAAVSGMCWGFRIEAWTSWISKTAARTFRGREEGIHIIQVSTHSEVVCGLFFSLTCFYLIFIFNNITYLNVSLYRRLFETLAVPYNFPNFLKIARFIWNIMNYNGTNFCTLYFLETHFYIQKLLITNKCSFEKQWFSHKFYLLA